jgi:NADH:ubiquinone oxidoreductase subunit E
MASKQTLFVTNAQDAEVALIKIMEHQDQLREKRTQALAKAKNAQRDQQYQFYSCQAKILDNKLFVTDKAIQLIAEFLPMPQNFPL